MRTDIPDDAAPGDLRARAFAALDLLAGDVGGLGIALSGGGDSVALMHLAAEWAAGRSCRLATATVDHGLRPESAAEAAAAGAAAARLGLPHQVLRWQAAGGPGNLMANARQARLDLLADWARAQGLDAVALGHTRDDLAETLLMRLARGAGIDGLAAMAARRTDRGMVWLRPLLDIGREELRDHLRARSVGWIDDPSNDNDRFERVRARQAIAALGLDTAALAQSAANLGQAREALNAALMPLLDSAEARYGSVLLDRAGFDAAPLEQRRRLVVAAVRFVTGAGYPPRRAGVEHALAALERGARVTLDGAVLDPAQALRVHREPAAAARANDGAAVWDNRWRIDGLRAGDSVAALGADAAAADWRAAGLTHLEAQALPAIRRAGHLIVPALEPAKGLTATPLRGIMDFHGILLGH
ncbi:tRNA lysidine(34) synthetase TilS [Paracoccus xiamenensis]|uniref:tRNA lysidine(34) synthetase TilS n=1 Tax=Paracoccus xiamenensis TaxID=2714901 RepID=UPI002E28EBA2|nr:tRNA lysidine(34) synthetase TilS [Paracoccus xiamenensis]